jgi:hypothetical protein
MSSLPSSNEEREKKKTWIGLIDESVHTSDDVDIGDIDAVSRDFVVVKRGFVNVHYYYIPVSKVEGWDGHVLWLKITEQEVIRNYEREITNFRYRSGNGSSIGNSYDNSSNTWFNRFGFRTRSSKIWV